MNKLKGFSIQKFDGKNFHLWKYQLEIVFRAEGILDIVDGTKVGPVEQNADQQLWEEKNVKAMLIISMKFDQLQVVMTCNNAANM